MTELTPLGRLLEAAREERGWSQREAAKQADVSATAWRRIVQGKAIVKGVETEFPGRPITVAQMAMAVELHPDEVERAGRSDVAAVMRHRMRTPVVGEVHTVTGRMEANLPGLTAHATGEVRTAREIRQEKLARAKAELLGDIEPADDDALDDLEELAAELWRLTREARRRQRNEGESRRDVG